MLSYAFYSSSQRKTLAFLVIALPTTRKGTWLTFNPSYKEVFLQIWYVKEGDDVHSRQ